MRDWSVLEPAVAEPSCDTATRRRRPAPGHLAPAPRTLPLRLHRRRDGRKRSERGPSPVEAARCFSAARMMSWHSAGERKLSTVSTRGEVASTVRFTSRHGSDRST